jgi:hypothetical protein
VLPEQGRSRALPVRSRASSRRHGVAPSSARTGRPGYQTLSASCGYTPAPAATVGFAAQRARPWPPPTPPDLDALVRPRRYG